MAGLQQRNGSYRILFRYQGKQQTLTLGTVSKEEAETKSAQIDYLLMRLKQKLAVLPPGVDIVEFVQMDGRALSPASPEIQKITLSAIRDAYVAAHEASLEVNTFKCIRIHFRHLEKHFGAEFCISDLQLSDLQGYVSKRAKAAGRNGRKLSTVTIQKELVTLCTAWNWAVKMKLLTGPFPNDGLRYPKTTEKPSFQTREEIQRRIKAGGMSDAEKAEMWEALYLTTTEIEKLLKHVKKNATQPFVYPMLCFAAHTGARRSEIIRTQISDIDFAGKTVVIHEKKRVRSQITTRRVPLSGFLIGVLKNWLKSHPGGWHLFCQESTVVHSKKRSTTTGHKGNKSRETTNEKRTAGVHPRAIAEVGPLTPDEAHDHLQRSLADSEWKEIKGWHCFRHSFVSACASRGVDQRLVEAWAGHMSPEMSKRYAHLYPSTQQEAIAKVFG